MQTTKKNSNGFDNFNKTDKSKYHEFLPDVLEVVEKPTSKIGSMVIYAIFLLLIIAFLLSYFGHIDVVVVSRGRILPEGNVRVVQPFSTGILERLYVGEGDYITEGQILAVLRADMLELDGRLLDENLMRLEIEREILINLLENGSIPDLDILQVPEHLSFLVSYYCSIEQNFESTIIQLQGQVSESERLLNVEITTLQRLRRQMERTENETRFMQTVLDRETTQELEIRHALVDLEEGEDFLQRANILFGEGILSEIALAEIESGIRQIENRINLLEGQVRFERMQQESLLEDLHLNAATQAVDILIQESRIEWARQVVAQSRLNIQRARDERALQYNTMLANINNEIFRITSDAQRLDLQGDLIYIRASASGTVHGVYVNTLGEVVMAGNTILTIVPSGEELIAELYVLNRDISQVNIGDDVRIKVDAYPFSRFGTLTGRVVHISANSLEMPQVGYVFRVRAEILETNPMDEGNLQQSQIQISSGMQITGEIIGEERRIIEYFLSPIVEAIDESIRQN